MSKHALKFQALNVVNNDVKGEMVVKIYGKTINGKTVGLSVKGYKPYFYVKCKSSSISTVQLKDKFVNSCGLQEQYIAKSLLSIEKVKKKEFMGYTGDENQTFLKVSFNSIIGHKKAREIFEKKMDFYEEIYEQGLDPLMRFFHDLDIRPCGWITADVENFNDEDEEDASPMALKSVNSKTLEYQIHYSALSGDNENLNLAPFKILSFDIECYSLSGSFPAAKRNGAFYAVQLRQFYNVQKKEIPDKHLHDIIMSSLGLSEDGHRLAKANGVPAMKVSFRSEAFKQKFIKESSSTSSMEHLIGVLKNTALSDEELADIFKKECSFPEFEGDPIIQIGNTVHVCGNSNITHKYLVVMDDCEPIEGVTIIRAKNEKDLLLKWSELVSMKIDPDVITGYNIFNFDFEYMYLRARELGIEDRFMNMSRMVETNPRYKMCRFKELNFNSSAIVNNSMKYIDMPGRVIIDLYKHVKYNLKLQKCSLNAVSDYFLKMKKEDLSAKEMFKIYREGGPKNMKTIGEYCIKDCMLCNYLMETTQYLTNTISMANVCSTPMEYLITRGQSVKVYSLIIKACSSKGYLVKDKKTFLQQKFEQESMDPEDDEQSQDAKGKKKFKGAMVLDCKENLYTEPVAVLDFNSLYPSVIIANGLSPERVLLKDKYIKNTLAPEILSVEYASDKIAKFVQLTEKAIVPEALEILIAKRKSAKIAMEAATDPTQKNILNGLQLAYKVTANSIYGTLGASNSPLYLEQVAASTTAIGRGMLMDACNYLTQDKTAEVIYGDTDSVFVMFPGIKEKGHDAIMPVIDMAKKLGQEFSNTLKKPLKLEYEKVFYPLLLMSKKRYIGKLYENDDQHSVTKSMGDVSVRQEIIPFVKKIYANIMDIVLNDPERGVRKSIDYFFEEKERLLKGEVPLQELIMSQTLGQNYKNPMIMKSFVVANKMAARDPGTRPQAGERVSFVFLKKPNKSKQADMVEDPEYAEANNLEIDYDFYLSNHVKNPILTIYGTMAQSIFPDIVDYGTEYQLLKEKFNGDEDMASKKLKEKKEAHVEKILFNDKKK